ncbi:MAG TPA: biopolymer transporter ExbD [Bacteroidales bacterium]|nr:biopolymer transporter ExbD [Bacteroidales bacterium]HRZ20812.1 biopolymer transporter ExbD [Bacteroidales bacterium]
MARKNRPRPDVNASSTADIAFLLLCFFLMASNMNTDSGIFRRLPPPIDPAQKPPEIKERNIFTILVNKNDRLLVEGREGDISTLKDQAKEFLSNPSDDINLPEKRVEFISVLGDFPISKGVISLKNDRGTSYEMYIKVQNELTKAINELRDELSRERFGIAFTNLNDTTYINAIQKAVPVSISEAEPENIGGEQ